MMLPHDEVRRTLARIEHDCPSFEFVSYKIKRRDEVCISRKNDKCVGSVCVGIAEKRDGEVDVRPSKKIGPQALRPKTLFRVGRALRLDVNLLTGSVRIVPNSIAWRKVVAREKVFWTSGRTESVLHGLD